MPRLGSAAAECGVCGEWGEPLVRALLIALGISGFLASSGSTGGVGITPISEPERADDDESHFFLRVVLSAWQQVWREGRVWGARTRTGLTARWPGPRPGSCPLTGHQPNRTQSGIFFCFMSLGVTWETLFGQNSIILLLLDFFGKNKGL